MTIVGLYIYPVKSCRGIDLLHTEIGSRGFLHDRELLVVDENDAFLTQRTAPKLATVVTELTSTGVTLNAPKCGELQVRLGSSSRLSAEAKFRKVTIFRDEVLAEDCGEEAAAWFSEVLGRQCRLVRSGPESLREVPFNRLPDQVAGAPLPQICFPDAFPILLITEESLAEVNRRIPRAVSLDRFRPNLVVRGLTAFNEDHWAGLRGESITFRCGPPCERCIITTTDQQTGVRTGVQPLRTLATFRATANKSGVTFGRYLLANGTGSLRVGESLSPTF